MREATDVRYGPRRRGLLRRVGRAFVFGVTLLFVVCALAVSCALVVYTAWRHDLSRGVFALFFAVLSAQIAVNWVLWKEDDGAFGEDPFNPR